MSSYIGKHAELYDLFYGDKPYKDEAFFVHQCLQRFANCDTHKLLELACGTGNHALEFEKLGYDIFATDYSEDMLRQASHKAQLINSKVKFKLQDMRTLNLDERPFDAIICLFDSIGYVVTNEALLSVLQGVYEHLRIGGLFIFEFWHAGAMLREYEPVRLRRFVNQNGEIIRISETILECAKQLSQVKYSIFELNNDGSYIHLTETQVNRYFLLQEMAGWLTSNGFEPVKLFAGFQDNEMINETTWHIVAVARRS